MVPKRTASPPATAHHSPLEAGQGMSRRQLLVAAPTAGAIGLGAAVGLAGDPLEQVPGGTPPAGSYRETQHIKTFYALARR